MNRTPRPFSILVALLAVCMFGAVGFRIGQGIRTSGTDAASAWQAAETAAYPSARARAYRSGWQAGYGRGWRAGAAAGAAAGARAGRRAGRAKAAAGTVAAREVAAVLAATPVKLGHSIRTHRCVEVAGGLCEALGPRITGRHCPPASVADPKGGVVCVPQVLLIAARMANAPSVSVFAP